MSGWRRGEGSRITPLSHSYHWMASPMDADSLGSVFLICTDTTDWEARMPNFTAETQRRGEKQESFYQRTQDHGSTVNRSLRGFFW